MTTALQLLEAAYSRSTANDAGSLAVDRELIDHLNRRYQLRFALLAMAAGDDMLATATLIFAGSPPSVALPADIVDIIRLERADGSKLHLIPADEKDRTWHIGPCVYRRGSSLISRNATGDPGINNTVTLLYLDAPAALTVLASVLDSRYPARYENLLILDLAMYLSGKDEGRSHEEYAELEKEHAKEEGAFNRLVYGSDTAQERPTPAQTAGKK